MRRVFMSAVVVLAVATAASAGIVGVSGGTGAPAMTLGPYTMTPFGSDTLNPHGSCTLVASPLGGNVAFSPAMDHLQSFSSSWSSWSHGWVGDVYWSYTFGAVTTITMTMPAETGAFYFYVSPASGDPDLIMATAQGTSVIQNVQGTSGASYYGFYGATNGDLISSITVEAPYGFAVGEFGIAEVAPVPLPGALILGALGLSFAGWRLKRQTV
jgi:hypothetical protein